MSFKDDWTIEEKLAYAKARVRFDDTPLARQVEDIMGYADTYEGTEREEPICAAWIDHLSNTISRAVAIIEKNDFVSALDGTHPSEDWRVAAHGETT